MHVAPAYISDTISWFYRFLLKCPDQPQDAPLYNPARRFEPAALFLCPFLSLALKEWHEIDGKSIESCLLLQLQKTWIRCWLAGGRSLVNLKFLGKKNLFMLNSSLKCPWQTDATCSALDQWVDAFSPHSCRVLSLPGSGGSLPAWSRSGSIRTSRQCACTGTYSPVYGSSWWCAGCYPPCSHSGHCSPAPCGRTTIVEKETETEMG